MYGLFLIGHYLFIGSLLAAGIVLFLLSVLPDKRRFKPGGRLFFYSTTCFTIVFFGLLVATQAELQLNPGEDLAEMISIFDNRSWEWEKSIRKGSIFDRSGLAERALAYSERNELGQYERRYPLGESSGHLVGYSSKLRGRTGLEEVFRRTLIGSQAGYVNNIVSAFSNRIMEFRHEGNDIYLTIDSRLQTASYEAMRGRKGAVIVMDPNTGEVLALVSSPGFSPKAADSEEMWRSILARPEEAPLFNRSLGGLYPPGSVMKLILAAAAIENNLFPEYISGPDGFTPKLAAKTIHDNEFSVYNMRGEYWPGHGRLTMDEALQKSSNVYFAKLAAELGAGMLGKQIKKFGFNSSVSWNTSNKILQNALVIAHTVFPEPVSMTEEEMIWSALGQYKVLVTPMHVALMTSTIANGGDLYKPVIELGRFRKTNGKAMTSRSAKILRNMMRKVVASGTGYRANVPGLNVAGKTGTAETGTKKSHSWFTSFAPADRPKMVVVVVVENGGYGGGAAAEAARDIYAKAKQLAYFNN